MSWHALEPADDSIFTSAPIIYRFPIRLAVPPARVWESLTSDRCVADWSPAVRKVEWTSPRPYAVGTTREVTLVASAIRVRERFFRWEEGSRYSFHGYEANRPVLRRLAEDYVVEADGTGSLLTWTVAIDPAPKLAPVMKVLAPVNRLPFADLARGAKRYFAKHP